VDFVTGYRADGYGAEFKLLIDVVLAERLFAAVNLNYALGTQKFDIPNARWERGSGTNISAALTAQVYAAEKQTAEGVFVGVEGRYRTLFDGLWLDRFAGDAFQFWAHAGLRFRRRQSPHHGVEPSVRRATVARDTRRAQPHPCRSPRVPREVRNAVRTIKARQSPHFVGRIVHICPMNSCRLMVLS
jgi:hypothetical protein